jgi:hypothetical protein
MSMLTEQCDKLRKSAYEVERIKNDNIGILMGDSITLADVAMQLREAADTIADLRMQLTDKTCHVKATEKMGDSFSFSLSCGHSMVSPFNDHPDYCPWYGRKVVE